MGGTYTIGKISMDKFAEGKRAVADYLNVDEDEIVLGSSTTQLFRNLAFAINFEPGDEIILSKLEHEANGAAWVDIATRTNLTLKWWTPSPSSTTPYPYLTPESLKPLLTPKTKLVSLTHTSNILGAIHPIGAIASLLRSECPRALLSVDGVSYAPHRLLDLKALDVDFYTLSWYKVYGPHIATLFASRRAQGSMRSLGHYFNPTVTLEHKLGLAGANYELTQALGCVVRYMKSVVDGIPAHEARLAKIVLDYLSGREGVTVYGPTTPDPEIRVPTISFTVEGRGSRGVVEELDEASEFALRWGHFYSKRLCDEVLGLGEEGVVRVSLVHYNTVEEAEGFVLALDRVLKGGG
ncbi:PLP-dependent transferase [Patellaria atrata CBS 101060]|uniref:PLP-dependent transferase n=1 Tax=Patellaria atrata CBS 101060 TaxID=1346257 RepID=A0A9P4S2P1_9PEZI|nr:PLP-dependent transferase [Patellaria atrata CBS 101060]